MVDGRFSVRPHSRRCAAGSVQAVAVLRAAGAAVLERQLDLPCLRQQRQIPLSGRAADADPLGDLARRERILRRAERVQDQSCGGGRMALGQGQRAARAVGGES